MKRIMQITIGVFISTFILIILSVVFLPDKVKIMGSAVANTSTYIPKIWAVILAALLSTSGVGGILISKKEEPKRYYSLVISVIGIGLFVYMLIANCLI